MVYYERTISKNGTVQINNRVYKCKKIPDELIGCRMTFEAYHHIRFIALCSVGDHKPHKRWDYSHDSDGGVTLWSSENKE